MSFKERKIFIEESIQDKLDTGIDKVKEFANKNPGITATGVGMGLGALTNYLSNGADTLHDSRVQDTADEVQAARANAVSDRLVPQAKFNNFVNGVNDAYDVGDVINPDITSFLPGSDSDAEALKNAESILKTSNAAAGREIFNMGNKGEGMSIDGYTYDPSISQDANYEMYKNHASKNPMTPEQKIAVDNAGERAQHASEKSIANSTRDSYLQKMALGGALGTGGAFAARKLNKKD